MLTRTACGHFQNNPELFIGPKGGGYILRIYKLNDSSPDKTIKKLA